MLLLTYHSLFENHKSSVPNLLADSYSLEQPLNIPLDVTLVEWNTLQCLLEGKILETHLSEELFIKASNFGFTSSVIHFSFERKRMLTTRKNKNLDLFIGGHGPELLIVSKNDYYCLKGMMHSDIVPVGVLIENACGVNTVVVHDNVLLTLNITGHIIPNNSIPPIPNRTSYVTLKDFDVNKLKDQLCFQTYRESSLLSASKDRYPNCPLYFTQSEYENQYAIYGEKNDYDFDFDDDDTLGDLFSSNMEKIMKACVSIIAEHDCINERDNSNESIFFRLYESYCNQLVPQRFDGEIDSKKIMDILTQHESLLLDRVNTLHKKSSIVGECVDSIHERFNLTTYTLCYCFTRLK